MRLSFVFPCLNEEETIVGCLDELKLTLNNVDFSWEIIIADNGSTDRSVELAINHPPPVAIKIVNITTKGYGAALQGGFMQATGEYIAFADCDGSYILSDVVKMLKVAQENNADMVVASRTKGTIEQGSMPFLHRYLGTPVLTFFINLLFAGKMSDCNSGLRLFKKSAYEKWNPKSPGMEFASELLIQALKHHSKVIEIPSGLRKDKRSRPPYLKTWRDGMRHLLFIFSEKPQFFEYLGLFSLLLGTLLQCIAFFTGAVNIAGVTIFGIHSKLLFLIFSSFGVQFYLFSLTQYTIAHTPTFSITKYFVYIDDAKLFFLLLATGLLSCCAIIWVFIEWGSNHFSSLNVSSTLLLVTHFLIVLGCLFIGLLGVHLLKRTLLLKSNQS